MVENVGSKRWACSLVGAATLGVCLFVAAEAKAQTEAQTEPAASSKREPRQTGFDLSAVIGGVVRLGDAPLFDVSQRLGGTLGLGFAYVLQPLSLGLSYEHTSLGREGSGAQSFGAVHIDRDVDTVWASLRMRLAGPAMLVPLFGVALGATWQSAHANGVFLYDGGLTGGTFGCSATDSINLAFRASGGVEAPVTKTLSLVLEGSFDAYRLSSEVFDGCAPGAGTTSTLGIRAGLTYRFDLTEGRDVKKSAQVR